ncbi:Replication factor A protein 1, partial [Teratosphaeriaceae sp. CCFEE 6253]
MASQQGQERYRVVMNDSHHFIQCMLASQCNHIISSGKLKKGNLARINDYQVNLVKDKNIMIVLDLEVLEEYGESEKLGMPVALETPKQQGAADVKPQPGNILGDN